MQIHHLVHVDETGGWNFPGGRAQSAAWLEFRVSLNEEHTFLTLRCGDRTSIDLGERAHHYCLLTLARRRLADAERGHESSSQGWIDIARLSTMLGLDAAHLNIQIFRARSQLLRALPAALAVPGLVERRRGELRIGDWGLRVIRGARLEGELAPPRSAEPACWALP